MTEGTLTLRGRIGTDLQTFKSAQGNLCVRFRLAVSKWRVDDSGAFQELGSQWFGVKAFGRLAENCIPSLRKGNKVMVIGRPTTEAWVDNDGKARSSVVLIANSIGHDLNSGTVRFTSNMDILREKREDQERLEQVRGNDPYPLDEGNSEPGGGEPTGECHASSTLSTQTAGAFHDQYGDEGSAIGEIEIDEAM